MNIRRVLLAVGALLIAASPSHAQSNVELRVVAQKEVRVNTDDGAWDYRLIPATEAFPGDELVYTIFFANVSDLPATNIIIDDPVPAQVYLKEGSVFGAGTVITYSIDGGKTFARPGELAVVDQGVAREATPAEYTHIRWVFGGKLPPGREGFVGFRAIMR